MIPKSFIEGGFLPADEARKRRFLPGLKRPGIMISSEGEPNTGKTEFILSCPGPGIVLAVDRMADSVMDNDSPPASRQPDFVFKEIMLSKMDMAENHLQNWQNYYEQLMLAIKNPDALTVGIDGDSDTWETQRVAAFGTLVQIPSIMYTKVNAARRAQIARLYDSGKIIVATNKVKAEYAAKRDGEGNVVLKDGKEIREKTGNSVRQGFEDDSFGWAINIRHLYRPPSEVRVGPLKGRSIPQQWGIRILKCKNKAELAGTELWGEQCNFRSLVGLAYPQVAPEEWGLK